MTGKKCLTLVWVPFPASNPENNFLNSKICSIVIPTSFTSVTALQCQGPQDHLHTEDSLEGSTGLSTQSYS